MRLVRAELLKARRRSATWVVFVVAVAIAAAIYLVAGTVLGGVGCQLTGGCLVEFPAAYQVANQVVFVLGGLLAVIYAAAFVGADWNWGVLRNVVARGESRVNYLLGKAVALAIIIAIAELLLFFFCIVMTYVAGALYGIPVASPLRGNGVADLLTDLLLGYPVLLERAAIGFAVAVLLRSQLAGGVIGVVLFVGEGIVTTLLTLYTLIDRASHGGFSGTGLPTFGPEWFQFLPIGVGGQVLNATPGATSGVGSLSIEGLFLRAVPVPEALIGTFAYMVVAVVIALIALNRQEIV
jgi:hypothetical protein